MPAISQNAVLISPDEYLVSEDESRIKREYVDGIVFAMADKTVGHNRIAGNVLGTLHGKLRGNHYSVWTSDTKVRIRMPRGKQRFYYPDVQVVCERNSPEETFQDRPTIVFEVSSPSTRRTDEGEKLDAYLTIPTLDAYVLVDAAERHVVVYQRKGRDFNRTVFSQDSDVIRFTNPDVELSLTEIYADAVFPPPEPEEEQRR